MKRSGLIIAIQLLSIPLWADVCNFTNGGGDGLWSNPANWSCGHVPGEADTVVSNTSITMDLDTTVSVLILSHSLSGLGRLIVMDSMTWKSGNITDVKVTVNGNFIVTEPGSKGLWGSDSLIINGTVVHEEGYITVVSDLIIGSTGHYKLTATGFWRSQGGGAIRNHGTLEIDRGGTPFFIYGGGLQIVNEVSGSMLFSSGADHGIAMPLTNYGIIAYNSGNELNLGSTFQNEGTLSLHAGATLKTNICTINAPVTINTDEEWVSNGLANVNTDQVVDGKLTVNQNLTGTGTVTVEDTMVWYGGNISEVKVTTNGHLHITGEGKTIFGSDSLIINGTAVHDANRITVTASLIVGASGYYRLSGSGFWRSQGGGAIRNHGNLEIDRGGTPFFIYGTGLQIINELSGSMLFSSGTDHGIAVPLTNYGSIAYNNGNELNLGSTFQNEGTLSLHAGATLKTNTCTINAPVTINTEEEWVSNGHATVNTDQVVDGKLTVNHQLTGTGTVTVEDTMVWYGGNISEVKVTTNGHLHITGEGKTIFGSDSLIINGTAVHDANRITVTASVIVGASGHYRLSGSGFWRSQGAGIIRNHGIMEIGRGGVLFFVYGGGLSFVNEVGGLFTNTDCTGDPVFNRPFTNYGSLDLCGNWTFSSPNWMSGRLSPGHYPDPEVEVLDINSYNNMNGTINIDLAGYGGGGAIDGHDSLHITGSATLGDTLEIRLINGFQIADCPEYTILTCAGGCNDTFDVIKSPSVPNATYKLSYYPNSVVLEVEVDADMDGFSTCSMPEGDCDDYDALEFPGQIWHPDDDLDDHGSMDTMIQCERPPGNYFALVELASADDCDDNDSLEFPGQLWYPDQDLDSYGPGNPEVQCERPAGNFFAAVELMDPASDCDDNNPATYPGAPEICDGEDNDCNGNPESAINTWTGLPSDSLWNDPSNWSDGFVPLECQEVVIPAGSTVVVLPFDTARCQTIDVELGTVFHVKLNGELEVGD